MSQRLAWHQYLLSMTCCCHLFIVSDADCTLQADLHGCQLTVLASKIGRHVGKQGIVVQVRNTPVSI